MAEPPRPWHELRDYRLPTAQAKSLKGELVTRPHKTSSVNYLPELVELSIVQQVYELWLLTLVPAFDQRPDVY